MKMSAANTRSAFARRLLRALASAMIVAGFAALAYVACVMVNARYFQETEVAKFAAHALAKPIAPLPKMPRESPIVPDGDVIGTIEIASVGLRSVVVQGDSSGNLRRAVGHVSGTPLPGEAGNIALAGHRDTIFRPLRNIKAGDLITLQTASSVIQYRVRSTEIVPPTDLGVLQSRGRNELTLITCYPFYYVGRAPNRFIVRAQQAVPSPQ